MNELVAFDFESHPVRIVTGTDGQPHFVAADICDALQIVEVHRSVARLDDDEKGRHIVTTPGGPQEMTVVNEAGLYSLILRSRKPEAKRFKRWVTHEVLPSIRKTGAYAAPGSIAALPAPTQDRVTSILLIGEAVARVPGVKPGIAMAAALTCIHENTGLAIETKLGEHIGLSAKQVNRRLADLGYQYRNERDEWELTEAGRTWGEALPFSRNGHSGYQILWKLDVADLVKEAA